MWRFIWYTKTSFPELERKLSALDGEGYRVELVLLDYFFRITRKTNGKRAWYRVTYLFPKMFDSDLYDEELALKRHYRGNPVKTKWSSIYLFKLSLPMEEDVGFDRVRDRYLVRAVGQQLFLAGFFLLGITAVSVHQHEETGFGAPFLFAAVLALVFLVRTVWKLIQWIRLRRRVRKYKPL